MLREICLGALQKPLLHHVPAGIGDVAEIFHVKNLLQFGVDGLDRLARSFAQRPRQQNQMPHMRRRKDVSARGGCLAWGRVGLVALLKLGQAQLHLCLIGGMPRLQCPHLRFKLLMLLLHVAQSLFGEIKPLSDLVKRGVVQLVGSGSWGWPLSLRRGWLVRDWLARLVDLRFSKMLKDVLLQYILLCHFLEGASNSAFFWSEAIYLDTCQPGRDASREQHIHMLQATFRHKRNKHQMLSKYPIATNSLKLAWPIEIQRLAERLKCDSNPPIRQTHHYERLLATHHNDRDQWGYYVTHSLSSLKDSSLLSDATAVVSDTTAVASRVST
jgi:hypothetical protein